MRLAVLPLVCLAASPAYAQNLFDAPRAEDFASRGVADVDLDGDLDAIATVGADQLAAYLNDGAGEFTAMPGVTFPSTGLATPAIGDWNGDGFVDLVKRDFTTPTASLRIALGNGDGTFQAPFGVGAGTSVTLLEFCDHDGVGGEGIVVARSLLGLQTELQVWFDDGAGVQSTTVLGLPSPPLGLGVADLDDDGDEEILVALSGPTRVLVVEHAAGVLSVDATFTVPGSPDSVAVPMPAGDLDGDGDRDVLACFPTVGGTLELMPLLNDGSGTLVAAPLQELSGVGDDLGFAVYVLADWDADGDLDVMGQASAIFSGTQRARWLENVGGAQFEPSFSVPLGAGGVPAGAGDFDGDGNVDFLTNTVLVYGDGTFTSPLTSDLPLGTRLSEAEDFEGDGDLDLVAWFDVAGDAVNVFTNDATGAVVLGPNVLPPPAQVPPNQAPLRFGQPALRGDFDGDGLDEIVVSVTQVIQLQTIHLSSRRFEDDGSGSYVDRGNAAPLGVALPDGVVVDLDGDGDLDVVAGGNLWANAGTGFFPGPTSIVGTDVRDVRDVDGDGDLDLLAVLDLGQTKEVRLERNDGALGFDSQLLLSFTNSSLPVARPFFTDVDADGDPDVVASFRYTFFGPFTTVLGAENVGGSFVDRGVLGEFSVISTLRTQGAGDVDGDGRLDLVAVAGSTSTSVPNRAYVLRQSTTPWTFLDDAVYLVGGVSALGDLEGDGDLDLLGYALHRAKGFEGPTAGAIRQYGAGVAGTAGAVPVVGSTGPMREGSNVELRIRRGLGGAPAIVARGLSEALFPNVPFPGLTLLVDGLLPLDVVALDGTPGVGGVGGYTQPVPLGAGLAGQSFFVQVFVVDPAGVSNLAQSNGLEVTVGG